MQAPLAPLPDASPNVVAIRSAVVRPLLYLTIILISVLAAFAYKMHTESVFACPAAGYGSGAYLAYCQNEGYGDYDHGAFWFGLEPEARQAAANADVLFIGNSRMQFGFSTEATKQWFAALSAPYYLLGFSFGENALFEAPLLKRLKPKAAVYIINVDRFFDENWLTQPTEALRSGADDIESRYEEKKRWQIFHKRICQSVPAVCGHAVAFYRSRDTGAWQLNGSENFKAGQIAEADIDADDIKLAKAQAAIGEKFLSQLPVAKDCVILTLAPWGDTPTAAAQATADALKLDLVAPKVEGLHTFDGDHLDPESAERWSSAFYKAAGPRIRKCVDDAHAKAR